MEKWADYLISEVRLNTAGTHIAKVRTHVDKGEKIGMATSEEQRGFVIDNINMGNTYATVVWDSDANSWNLGAKVQVVVIEGEKFIKTKADNIKKDNLDNLPSF